MAMECLACFGERETPRRAVYEAHAELGLQRSDAAAQLRGLQAQRFRRCRIGAEVDYFGEEIEVVEVLNRGHAIRLIVLFRTNMHSIWSPAQVIIARIFSHESHLRGAKPCRINFVSSWDSPLMRSRSRRAPG